MNGRDMDDRQTLGVSQSSRDISSPLRGKLLIDGHASVVKSRRVFRCLPAAPRCKVMQ
jgi:adenylate cyclase